MTTGMALEEFPLAPASAGVYVHYPVAPPVYQHENIPRYLINLSNFGLLDLHDCSTFNGSDEGRRRFVRRWIGSYGDF